MITLRVVCTDVTSSFKVDRKQAIQFLTDNIENVTHSETRDSNKIVAIMTCNHNKLNLEGVELMKYSLKVRNQSGEFLSIIHTNSLNEFIDFQTYFKEIYDNVRVTYADLGLIELEVSQ